MVSYTRNRILSLLPAKLHYTKSNASLEIYKIITADNESKSE